MLHQAARRPPVAFEESDYARPDPVILLVTSDRELRESAALALAHRGYRVVAASHAGHAVLACIDVPRMDVAAIELSMDDMSGPVLAERLRRRCPGLRSLYLAKPGTPECEGVLVRPFSRDDLIEKLIDALTPLT